MSRAHEPKARASGVWVVPVALLVLVSLVSCGNDEVAVPAGTSEVLPTLEEQVDELDALLRESIAEVGLDPGAGRREVVDNSCVGPGGNGRNVRYYYDEPSHDRGVEYLSALEAYWSQTDGFGINDPLQDDGSFATLLAVSGEFRLGAYRFPASEELAIGGSTPCIS